MTDNSTGNNGLALDPRHLRELVEGSGIAPDVIRARGYRTTTRKAVLARLGFGRSQQRTPVLVIPMHSPVGELVTHQIKPAEPRTDQKGKPIRYETPYGSEIRLDAHPTNAGRMRDASVPLWIVEGVKKADSLTSRGECAVALQGVWCWQRDGVPLPEWEDVRLYGREVLVCFDSDVTTNARVQSALAALVAFLKGRGAVPRIVYLPEGPGRTKTGVDDFLVRGGTVEEMKALAEDDLREDLVPLGRLLSEVETTRVRWLWPRRIPFGKITIIEGDPDHGKSVLTTDLIARVTAGRNLPDGTPTEQAGAILIAAEDGEGDTIRPRLEAAGGDASRVKLLGTFPDGEDGERLFALPDDVPLLERAIKEIGAALVVIDPLSAFPAKGINLNHDTEARRALSPLKGVAERTGAAVVLVRHLNKSQGGNPLYRGGASIGIIGLARSAMVVGDHPELDDVKVLAPQKLNIAQKPESLTYRIEGAENGAARIVYRGASSASAKDILNVEPEEERSALADAKDFLREILRDGPVESKTVEEEAEAAGVAPATLNRAKREIKVRSKKIGNLWKWLPPEHDGDDPDPSGGRAPQAGRTSRDQDDHLDNLENLITDDRLDNLDSSSSSSYSNPPYISEDDQDDQDDHDRGEGGWGLATPRGEDDRDLPHDGHLDPTLLRRVEYALRQKRQGPALNLPLYREGKCSLEILTNSVLYLLREERTRMAPGERREWEWAVESVAGSIGGGVVRNAG